MCCTIVVLRATVCPGMDASPNPGSKDMSLRSDKTYTPGKNVACNVIGTSTVMHGPGMFHSIMVGITLANFTRLDLEAGKLLQIKIGFQGLKHVTEAISVEF